MRILLLAILISLLHSCSDPNSIPPDKHAVHVNLQIERLPERPKTYYEVKTALEHIDSVKVLVLRGTKFEDFPIDIFKLVYLEELTLDNCGFDSIPELIGNLKNLKYLNVRSNKLRKLPKQLFTLTNLEELDNFGNEINILPPEISNLTNLKDLNVSFNNLKNLPDLTALSHLHNLSCDGNFLSVIPPSVCSLKKLTRLSLIRNKISKIDNCVAGLPFLKQFVLGENYLSPLEIEKVQSLLPDCLINTDMQN